MPKLLLQLFALLLCTNLLASRVEAAGVKPVMTITGGLEPIYLGDSVILELETVGIDAPIDISPLFQDADLLRETSGTRIAVIDDQVAESKTRRMEFIPRHEGRAIFGPLSGSSNQGIVHSNTIIIEVLPPADINWQPGQEELQIDISLSTTQGNKQIDLLGSGPLATRQAQLFVGQHIVADIELRHRYPIADEQIGLPGFEGFDVLEQFVERRTIEKRENEEPWRITAWRYHLFPQHSGQLGLAPATWKGTAIRSRTQRSTFERHSQTATLDVEPAVGTAQWWLPANEVSLSDSWSKDPRKLSAGDEILRTITLSATGVLANHLPTVTPPESRALTVTAIGQSRSQKLSGNRITATAVFEFRITAQSPIPVFLDTVRVPWFSTEELTAREAIIPARRINIGLPERADLLASLAIDNNRLDTFLLRLESRAGQWLPWHITLILLSLVAALIWLQQLRNIYGQRSRREQDAGSTVLPEL